MGGPGAGHSGPEYVTPAYAAVQGRNGWISGHPHWIPAVAGMTWRLWGMTPEEMTWGGDSGLFGGLAA